MRLVLLLGLLVSSVAFADERIFGDYRVSVSSDNEFVMAETKNAAGDMFMYFCEVPEKRCSYRTVRKHQNCVEDSQYPVLIGTGNVAMNAYLRCQGSLEGGHALYIFTPYKELNKVIGDAAFFGYASANADGSFSTQRFSTKGLKEALGHVGSVVFDINQSATAKKMSLWQAIEALTQQIPFTKAKIEGVLSTELTDNGGDVFQFYKSNRIELGGGVEISNVDLRIKRSGAHPGFMVLDIGGSCIKLEQVRSHYGEMKITDMPHGQSLDEETAYTTVRPWGELSFGFAERNRDCLASIAFEPKEMK